MPGTITPQPSPFVHVTEQAQPSASMAEMWVVAPSRPAMNVAPNPGSARASRKAGVRSPWAASMAATSAPMAGGDGARSSRASASASRMPPAFGGGFVATVRPR